MTCVLSSPWQPFNTSFGWSPMNTAESNPSYPGYEQTQRGYASSESESRQTSSNSAKKRASRAGTRSVTTLSAAQLERKRANDREAQRAIRQRTKDHIDGLERNINDLRAAHDASEKLVTATQQRNRELEEENAYLRTKLGESAYPGQIAPNDSQRPPDFGPLPPHATPPASQPPGINIPRPTSTSTPTPQSAQSLSTSEAPNYQSGPWQQTPSTYGPPTSAITPTMPPTPSVQLGPNLSTWRSHESSTSLHSNRGQAPEVSQAPPQVQYGTTNPNDKVHWPAAPQPQPYSYPEQQLQRFEAPPQQQQHYPQAPMPNYAAATPPQHAGYHTSPPPPPHTEFQGMTVSSPTAYQVPPPQQPFPQPPAYNMAPMPVVPAPSNQEYQPQQGQMQPPPMPAGPYHPAQSEPYGQPQVHPPMQFRESPVNRGYSLTHYPAG